MRATGLKRRRHLVRHSFHGLTVSGADSRPDVCSVSRTNCNAVSRSICASNEVRNLHATLLSSFSHSAQRAHDATNSGALCNANEHADGLALDSSDAEALASPHAKPGRTHSSPERAALAGTVGGADAPADAPADPPAHGTAFT